MAWLVGVYLRDTRRVNEDAPWCYQHWRTPGAPRTGSPVAKVIHNFGRADKGRPGGAGPAGRLDRPVPPSRHLGQEKTGGSPFNRTGSRWRRTRKRTTPTGCPPSHPHHKRRQLTLTSSPPSGAGHMPPHERDKPGRGREVAGLAGPAPSPMHLGERGPSVKLPDQGSRPPVHRPWMHGHTAPLLILGVSTALLAGLEARYAGPFCVRCGGIQRGFRRA